VSNDALINDFLPPLFAEHLQIEIPPSLYHYTDQGGLLGIISNGELWATNVNYMNDATESYTAIRIAERWLSKTEYNLDNYIDLEIAPERVSIRQRTAISMSKSLRNIAETGNVCVACFCVDDDLLSQWRGYAANSFGYSVGFKSAGLMIFGNKEGFRLGKCIYDIQSQLRIIRQICDHYLDESIIESHAIEDIIQKFVHSVRECGAFFKSPGFSEEKEWRLVCPEFPMNRVRFRRGKSFIIPYGSCGIGKMTNSCINGIRIGPCPHVELAKAAVSKLLHKNGICQRVEHSSIPFRDW
jgi:hypothetical protein